jgi:replicative DNA helicase
MTEANMKNRQSLPNNLEAEEKFIGTLLHFPDEFFKVADKVPVQALYQPSLQEIYKAISVIMLEKRHFDLVALSDQLERTGKLDSVGGAYRLIELANSVVTSVFIKNAADVILDRYRRRELIRVARETINDAYESPDQADQILNRAQGRLLAIEEQPGSEGPQRLGDMLPDVLEWAQEIQKRADTGKRALGDVPTGIWQIDSITGGFDRGDMIILAARPSVGKTALAMRIMENVGMRGGTCLGFSIEMGKVKLAQRALFSNAEVSLHDLKTGRLLKKDYAKLMEACNRLSELPIYLDGGDVNLTQIVTRAERVKREAGKLDLVFVDYVQLIDVGDSKSTRNDELEFVSRKLKRMAERLHCPVVVLSQLSREAIKVLENDDPEPDKLLGCLRSSGGFENDADIAMFLWRKKDDKGTSGVVERGLTVAKSRNGEIGRETLRLSLEWIRFLDDREENDQQMPF